MKTAIFLFLIAALAGVVGWRYYERSQHPTLGQRVDDLADKGREAATGAKEAATGAKEAVAGKAEDWKLTSADIKEELAKTGQVVRSKTAVIGDRIGDARIVAVVKAKFVLDRELSALDINVDCRDGDVSLRGTVATHELIGKAVVLALDTDGVRNVASKLKIGRAHV
jgi:hypothetical protein